MVNVYGTQGHCVYTLPFKSLGLVMFIKFSKFIPVMAELNLGQSLLQSSVSHDPSEIIIIC